MSLPTKYWRAKTRTADNNGYWVIEKRDGEHEYNGTYMLPSKGYRFDQRPWELRHVRQFLEPVSEAELAYFLLVGDWP